MSHRFPLSPGRAIALGLTLAVAFAAAPVFAQSTTGSPLIGMVLVRNASPSDAKGATHSHAPATQALPPVFAAPAGTLDLKRVALTSIVRIGAPHDLSSIGIPSVDPNPTDSVQPSKH